MNYKPEVIGRGYLQACLRAENRPGSPPRPENKDDILERLDALHAADVQASPTRSPTQYLSDAPAPSASGFREGQATEALALLRGSVSGPYGQLGGVAEDLPEFLHAQQSQTRSPGRQLGVPESGGLGYGATTIRAPGGSHGGDPL